MKKLHLSYLIRDINSSFSVLNKFTYLQLENRIEKIQKRLLLNKISQYERIMVKSNKSLDFVALMLASWRNNNVFVPVSDINQHVITKIKPSLIVDEWDSWTVIGLNKDNFCEENDAALILFTSGTTSKPKAVVLSHKNIYRNIEMIGEIYDKDISRFDKSFSILPWHHCYGLVCELLYLLNRGASITTPSSTVPMRILEEIKWNSPSLLFIVPKILENIVKKTNDLWWMHKKVKKSLFFGNNLRMISIGGSMCNIETIQLFQKQLEIPIYQGYGMTELSPMISLNSYDYNCIGSVGKPLRGIEIKIKENGEIYVGGDSLMMGYLDKIQDGKMILEKPLTDGLFSTGDKGFLNKDGFLYLNGRTKNEYKLTSGKYIHPEFIESIIILSPYIEQVIICPSKCFNYNVCIVYSSKSNDFEFILKEIQTIMYKNNFSINEIPKKIIPSAYKWTVINGLLSSKLEPNRKKILDSFYY